jgi:hypothetical protein
MLNPVLKNAIIIPKPIFMLGMNMAMRGITERQGLRRNKG